MSRIRCNPFRSEQLEQFAIVSFGLFGSLLFLFGSQLLPISFSNKLRVCQKWFAVRAKDLEFVAEFKANFQ